MNRIEQLYRASSQPAAYAKGYLDYLREVLSSLDVEAIGSFIGLLLEARERGARIFFCGNGGSAAAASHFANDLAMGCQSWEKPFRAVSLTDNIPILTAVSNDYGYDEVFVRQLQTQMEPGDVVVGISVSGNSPNVLKAIAYAKANGAFTVGLTGFDGGQLKPEAHVNLHIPTHTGEYGPAEDGHIIIDHLVGSYLLNFCRAEQRGEK
jgi:D-sedoheptulose 7-phosphate isomerase